MTKKIPDLQELCAFENSLQEDSTTDIEKHLNRFNPLRVLEVEHKEKTHSDVIAWLLNPKENHNLKTRFLYSFLQKVYNGTPNILQNEVDVKKEFYTGDGRIDIFVEINKRIVLVIENKTGTGEGNNQLQKYYDFIEKKYKEYTRIYVYLTKHGARPSHKEYKSLGYKDILEMLEKLKNHEKIDSFIENYMDTIKEILGMTNNKEQIEKAKKLYFEYKDVINFINNNINYTEFPNVLSTIFEKYKNDEKYKFFPRKETFFDYVPDELDQYLSTEEKGQRNIKEYSWETSYLHCRIHLDVEHGNMDGVLRLYLYKRNNINNNIKFTSSLNWKPDGRNYKWAELDTRENVNVLDENGIQNHVETFLMHEIKDYIEQKS